MMRLKIEKNNYGLRVYCTKCKRQYYHHNINQCKHEEYQHYKSIVSYSNGRKAKMYKTKKYDEALISAIQFKKDVKNGVLNESSIKDMINLKNISIIDAANMFLEYKYGIGVPVHLKKEISKSHLNEIKNNVQLFVDILREKKVNVENITIDSLNDEHVGYWYEYVTDKYSEGSLNTKLKIIKSFVNHMIEQVGVVMKNPFKRVSFNEVLYSVNSITKEEFFNVIDAVENKTPFQQLGGNRRERKNRYKSYLINGFKLALYTGLRHEELVTLTWNDLFFSKKNNCYMFVIDNLKVERITGKKFKKKYIPVGEDLFELLQELGFEDLKESELYVLEPKRTISYKTMMANLSKGFSHYYKQAYPNREGIKFKVLRKTYLTYLNKEVGKNMIELSSHGSMKTLQKHYIDEEIATRGLNMRIFE